MDIPRLREFCHIVKGGGSLAEPKAWSVLTSTASLSGSGHKSGHTKTHVKGATTLIGTSRTDLRRAHGLCHAEEHDDPLAAAARRECLVRVFVATIDVLPVVHHPHVARG